MRARPRIGFGLALLIAPAVADLGCDSLAGLSGGPGSDAGLTRDARNGGRVDSSGEGARDGGLARDAASDAATIEGGPDAAHRESGVDGSVDTGLPNGGATIAEDNFGRTVVGGLGIADVGGPWTLSGPAADFAVTRGTASVTLPSQSAERFAYLGSVKQTSADVYATFSIDKLGGANGTFLWLLGRWISATVQYQGLVHIASTGTIMLEFQKFDDSTTQEQLASLALSQVYVAGTMLDVRLEVQAMPGGETALRMRVWTSTMVEPTAWQLSAVDAAPSSALQAAGAVGIQSYLSEGATNYPIVESISSFLAVPIP